MSLDDDAREELSKLETAHRRRTMRVVDGRQGRTIVIDGVEVLNLSSNDYLGLAGDPRIAAAGIAELERSGSGAGASRLISGNHRAHVELERSVESWLRVPAGGVRVFSTGYAANVGVLGALLGTDDVVLSDELNHASIIDGCRLSRARVVVYRHRDAADLEDKLRGQASARRRIVVTETLFSMDGDIADLGALAALCARHDAALIVDEAHAMGALGEEGRGLAVEAGIVPDVVIGTFGKALGTFGAFAATTPAISELLWNRARTFVFSTGMPPAVAAMTSAAIEIVRGAEGAERRRRLEHHARAVRAATVARPSASAIVPFVIGDDRLALRVSAELLAAGLHVQAIRPPTVPEGTARLRLSLSAGLTEHDTEIIGVTMNDAVRRFT